MQSILMQPWITIRSLNTILSVAQETDAWLSVPQAQDVVFWTDCREVTLGGGTSVQLFFETAPGRDENLFQPLTSAVVTLAASATPQVTRTLNISNPLVPVATFVRWRLVATGPTSAWDATFRVFCCIN